jgi:hypothetical protein
MARFPQNTMFYGLVSMSVGVRVKKGFLERFGPSVQLKNHVDSVGVCQPYEGSVLNRLFLECAVTYTHLLSHTLQIVVHKHSVMKSIATSLRKDLSLQRSLHATFFP